MADQQDQDDKTEQPSGRRIEKAREDGKVALSPEVPALAVLGAAALVLMLNAPATARMVVRRLAVMIEQAHLLEPVATLRMSAVLVVTAAAPFVLAALLCASLAILLQTGFLVSTKALVPDFSRLSPMRGLSRLFGVAGLVNIVKSVAKVFVVGYAGWWVLFDALPVLPDLLARDAMGLIDQTIRLVLQVLMAMLVAQAVIAVLDVVHVRYRHTRSLRMTRQELRDEAKEMEGDPHIKGRLKQIRMQRARRRMLAAVPKATVVITNPTHYAVALVYARDGGGAPRIVAKGVDSMAARIREVAAEHNVPIVANPPLARALYPHELDREIPSEFYQPVAEIIAYIWRLR